MHSSRYHCRVPCPEVYCVLVCACAAKNPHKQTHLATATGWSNTTSLLGVHPCPWGQAQQVYTARAQALRPVCPQSRSWRQQAQAWLPWWKQKRKMAFARSLARLVQAGAQLQVQERVPQVLVPLRKEGCLYDEICSGGIQSSLPLASWAATASMCFLNSGSTKDLSLRIGSGVLVSSS